MGRSKAGFCHDGRVEQGKVGTLRTARSGSESLGLVDDYLTRPAAELGADDGSLKAAAFFAKTAIIKRRSARRRWAASVRPRAYRRTRPPPRSPSYSPCRGRKARQRRPGPARSMMLPCSGRTSPVTISACRRSGRGFDHADNAPAGGSRSPMIRSWRPAKTARGSKASASHPSGTRRSGHGAPTGRRS